MKQTLSSRNLIILIVLLLVVQGYGFYRIHTVEKRLESVSIGMAESIKQSDLNNENLKTFVDYVSTVLVQNELSTQKKEIIAPPVQVVDPLVEDSNSQ